MTATDAYTTIRTVGGLLPPDLLGRIAAGDDLPGLSPSDYHLASGESLRAAANRAWQYLLGTWSAFRDALATQPEGERATGLTREKWLLVLLRELGFGRIPVTPAGGIAVDGKAFPVSHVWENVPIHLLGWGTDLDTRSKGVAGAAGAAPQSLVQELLNRSDAHLWAITTNGRTFRLLRDSTSLVGQAYVEFDLEAMFDGEVFSDFVLFFLLAHQSRFERLTPDGPASDCWLERWRGIAADEGTRALDRLRDGVTTALETLGTGFWTHPANTDLRTKLASGEVTPADYQRALLRLVYRLLFAFVAEDRGALVDPNADPATVARYQEYFSTARLRRLAQRRRGSNHDDLYTALTLVFNALGCEDGLPQLGIPGIGGLYEATALDSPLDGARLTNATLLGAVRALSVVQTKAGGPRRLVDYRNLGAEELGSVYESLLEVIPRLDDEDRTYRLESAAGNERKTSGSYYTPSDLVDLVLDTALDPLLDEAVKTDDPEAALLALTVTDPAMGSAHFLVSAARRIAKRLAGVRTGDPEPAPAPVAEAMHDVVSRCIYGVDINPMAVELAKISLWLEALQPGRPLSFLDAHLKVGNALLGATPALLDKGIPDEAFVALTGDDKKHVTALKKRNKTERDTADQGELFTATALHVGNQALAKIAAEVDGATASSLTQVHAQAQRHAALLTDEDYVRARRAADAWCAAFVAPKTPDTPAITDGVLRALRDAPETVPATTVDLVDALAARYRFFHWHLEFPQLFHVGATGEDVDPDTGWSGGVSCALANPPWERVKLQEQEFFAARDPDIANAANAAARKKAIAVLERERPELHAEFQAAVRQSESESHFLRVSGRYPLTGRGDVNTYSVFAEGLRSLVESQGQCGIITPTGLATDATTAPFFADTLRARRLAAFYDFENEARIFVHVHHAFRFAVTVISGRRRHPDTTRLAFVIRHVQDVTSRAFPLDPEEVLLLNPNTGTLPVFRSRRDAEIALKVYRRFPVLVAEEGTKGNAWSLTFTSMFHMSNDASLFRTAPELEEGGAAFDGWSWRKGEETWLPLYEAKMLGHWDDRYSTYAGATQAQLNVGSLPRPTAAQLDDPFFEPVARYWVLRDDVERAVGGRWNRGWILGWRDITNAGNERTFVTTSLPRSAVGNKFPLAMPTIEGHAPLLQAVWSSFAFDYIVRQKMQGTTLNFYIVKQLACPTPLTFEAPAQWNLTVPVREVVRGHVLELAYTSWLMVPFSEELGDAGPPFRWITERREAIRAELDAMIFHVYGLEREEVDHVMDSFVVARKYDERDHEEFRTKRLILEYYDALAEAAVVGVPYRSTIDPPPGMGPRHTDVPRGVRAVS